MAVGNCGGFLLTNFLSGYKKIAHVHSLHFPNDLPIIRSAISFFSGKLGGGFSTYSKKSDFYREWPF